MEKITKENINPSDTLTQSGPVKEPKKPNSLENIFISFWIEFKSPKSVIHCQKTAIFDILSHPHKKLLQAIVEKSKLIFKFLYFKKNKVKTILKSRNRIEFERREFFIRLSGHKQS